MKTRTVEFNVGGAVHCLRLGMNAMVRFEESARKNDPEGLAPTVFLAAQQMELGNISATVLRRLFWAGVTPNLSEDEVGDLVDEIGINKMTKLLGESLSLAFDGLGDGGNDPVGKPKPPRKKS